MAMRKWQKVNPKVAKAKPQAKGKSAAKLKSAPTVAVEQTNEDDEDAIIREIANEVRATTAVVKSHGPTPMEDEKVESEAADEVAEDDDEYEYVYEDEDGNPVDVDEEDDEYEYVYEDEDGEYDDEEYEYEEEELEESA